MNPTHNIDLANGSCIGCSVHNTTPAKLMDGLMAEIILLEIEDAATRQKIEGYLAWK